MNKKEHKKAKLLIRQTKGIIKRHKGLVKLKEPIVQLIRTGGKVEWYDNIQGTEFLFTHSNGKDIKILLGTEYLKTFSYGTDTLKGYILDENNATPLPQKPLIGAEIVSIAIDKTLHDIKSWKAKEIEAKGKFILYIGLAIGIIILGYVLYKLLVPAPPPEPTTIVRNASQIAKTIL